MATDDVDSPRLASPNSHARAARLANLTTPQTSQSTASMTRLLPLLRLKNPLAKPPALTRAFSLLNPTQRSHTNRIFDPVRQPNDLHTLTLLNAADNRSLITFWSASWCQTCQTVKPLIRSLVEEEKVGEREGGLGFVEVQMDSTLIEDLPIRYRVSCSRLHSPCASPCHRRQGRKKEMRMGDAG